MTVKDQIENFINEQPEPKRGDIQTLHLRILQLLPGCKLWFDTGKNEENKTVNNPTIGYGHQIIKYAGGKTRVFFQIGLSPNKTGISVYIPGISDKTYLAETYGKQLGKAKITGYCIRFNKLKDIKYRCTCFGYTVRSNDYRQKLNSIRATINFGLIN